MLFRSGSRDENLRKAARQLRNAMEEMEPAVHPALWAMANTHLGEVCLARAHTDLAAREALLQQAERCFRAALGRATAAPRVRARAHAGLGWALGDQTEAGAPAEADAIVEYEAAIALYEGVGPALDTERGRVHHNLGLLYAGRALGERAANIAAAERHFRTALGLFPPEACPVERRDTLRPMGTLYFEAERWAEASSAVGPARFSSTSMTCSSRPTARSTSIDGSPWARRSRASPRCAVVVAQGTDSTAARWSPSAVS